MCYGGRDPYYRPFIGVRNNLSGSNAGEPLESDLVYYYPRTSYTNNNPFNQDKNENYRCKNENYR